MHLAVMIVVIAVAKAFGGSIITNATGGLATCIEEGVFGVVLRKSNPAGVYVDKINKDIKNPDLYDQLRKTSCERYEAELKWNSACERIVAEKKSM